MRNYINTNALKSTVCTFHHKPFKPLPDEGGGVSHLLLLITQMRDSERSSSFSAFCFTCVDSFFCVAWGETRKIWALLSSTPRRHLNHFCSLLITVRQKTCTDRLTPVHVSRCTRAYSSLMHRSANLSLRQLKGFLSSTQRRQTTSLRHELIIELRSQASFSTLSAAKPQLG